MKLLIATCFYKKEINPEHVSSIIDLTHILHEMGVEYEYCFSKEKTDKSKNAFVNKLLSSDFTHMLLVDPNISWDVRGVIRLLKAAKHGAELIGGVYSQFGIYDVEPITEDGYVKGYDTKDFRLIESNFVNGGFILYSRKAFERVSDFVESYTEKTQQDEEFQVKEFFKMVKEFIRSEDVFFQKTYKEHGGQILIEPNITFKFYGSNNWKGNYNQFLLGAG